MPNSLRVERALLVLLAASVPAGCSASSQAPPRAPSASSEGCRRLLPGPLGAGVPWEIDSPWQRAALPTARPEEGLEPLARVRFDEDAVGRSTQGIAETAHFAASFPAAPLTSYVLTFRTRTPRSAGAPAAREKLCLWILELKEDPSGSGLAGEALAEREKALVAAKRSVEPERIGGDGEFERWRVAFTTRWQAEALVVALFGGGASGAPVDSALGFGELRCFEVPTRAALLVRGLGDQSFDLPSLRESLDVARRLTKVRCDWETRPSLLLTPGPRARCEFEPSRPGGRLELGLAIVREERLTRGGAHTESVRVRVTAGAGASERVLSDQRAELRLARNAPSCWRDLVIELPPSDPRDGALKLELVVAGRDAPDGALVALGDPVVFPRAAPASERWNVVVVSIDTMRSDRLGATREGAPLTPHLDELSRHGAVFTQALANASFTLPSHVSLFTSQHPGEHGVLAVGDPLAATRSANLAQELAHAGWYTAAFTSGGMLNAEFCGIDAGFDRFGEIDPMLSPDDSLRRIAPLMEREEYNRALAAAGRLDERVLPWLRDHRDAPFLLFLHTYLVHNYQPERELARRFEPQAVSGTRGLQFAGPVPHVSEIREVGRGTRPNENVVFPKELAGPREFVPERDLARLESLYDATIFQADRDLGRLFAELDRLGLAERTIVVVLSDHGEEFLEHGDLSHARTLFDEILRVPLILRVPGLAARTVDTPVELVDVAPTLLELLRVRVDPRMRGRSLLDEELDERVTLHEGIEVALPADASGGGERVLRAARTRGMKLISPWRVQPASERPDLSEATKEELERIGYLQATSGDVERGGLLTGLFDLAADPREQRRIEGELDARSDARFRALFKRLWQSPARPAATKEESSR